MDHETYVTVTVDVEEWFHSNWFNVKKVINDHYKGIYPETDIINDTRDMISFFDDLNIRVTFFILGETALKYPEIVDLIDDAGHEIASHGMYHEWNGTNQQTFSEHLRLFKQKVYSHPKGFRFPNYYFTEDILRVLYDEGFLYDSSVVPSFNIPGWYGNPTLPLHPYQYKVDSGLVREFPISVSPILRMPGAGGWFLRNLGLIWTLMLTYLEASMVQYANIYVHTWEFSRTNPRISDIPFHVFRNTGRTMKNRTRHIINSWKMKKEYHIVTFEDLLDHEINTTC